MTGLLHNYYIEGKQIIDIKDGWWRDVYNLICSREENRVEFMDKYLSSDNIADSIMRYRTELIKRGNISFLPIKRAAIDGDKNTLKQLLRDAFLEPINNRDVSFFMDVYKSGMDIDELWEFYKKNMGRRFTYVIKHFYN